MEQDLIFTIGPADHKYQLTISGFDRDGLTDPFSDLNKMPFSSRDQDNDNWKKECAKVDGGMWYNACAGIELNDEYGDINMHINGQYSTLTFFEMKIRPSDCAIS